MTRDHAETASHESACFIGVFVRKGAKSPCFLGSAAGVAFCGTPRRGGSFRPRHAVRPSFELPMPADSVRFESPATDAKASR
jgi:hypothetical protein